MNRIWICLLALCLLLAGCEDEPETVRGWVSSDGGKQYYQANGEAVTGWRVIDGTRYYFDENGLLYAGWTEYDGSRYYINADGIPVSGWQEIEGQRYYFRSDGRMVTGWLYLDGKQYFLRENGALATGYVTDGGRSMLFSEEGTLYTGFVDGEGKPCHQTAEGAAPSPWAQFGGNRYYLREDGSLCTGWLEEDGKTYYFREDGTMAVGETEIDGSIYHFNPHGVRVILVNPWNYIPDGYEVELVQYDDTFSIGKVCYDALMEMLDACRAAGCDPVLVSGYRTQISQEWLYENRIQRWMEEGYGREEATKLAGTSVAIPGTSEHQLGLAVDLVDDENRSLTEVQESTSTQQWLMEHCWEYGFILRYPSDKSDITGIIYEPWHYRYVGTEIALELRDLGITLEEYLGAASHE